MMKMMMKSALILPLLAGLANSVQIEPQAVANDAKRSLARPGNGLGPSHRDVENVDVDTPRPRSIGQPTTKAWNQDNAHSQKGQDQWVFELLGIEAGYFVDLAANEPVSLSNTYALEQAYGWKGICIDGNEEFIAKYKVERSCVPVHAAVDCVGGIEVQFANRGVFGGIIGEDMDNKHAVDGMTTVVLKSQTLEDILDKANAPNMIDYLSLDVEGAEYRVLYSFPFKRYSFRAITVERPPPWLNNLLVANGYVWVKNNMNDSFYVHSSDKHAMLSVNRSNLTEFDQVSNKCNGLAGTSCDWPSTAPDLTSECSIA